MNPIKNGTPVWVEAVVTGFEPLSNRVRVDFPHQMDETPLRGHWWVDRDRVRDDPPGVTKETIAKQLHGMEYGTRIPRSITKAAKEANLLIVHGASDDLIQFFGVWEDEVGARDKTVVTFDEQGFVPAFDSVHGKWRDAEDALAWAHRCRRACEIHVHFGASGWTYSTSFPVARFDIVEDNAVYCRGMVFGLQDVGLD